MSIKRPGEFIITDKGIKIMGLSKGSKILEIGCGEGDTLEYLEKMGYEMTGLDMNLKAIQIAKDRKLKADIKFGDGEFLDEFSSYHFDGVIMECVLSLINLPDEALHEVYCVLKKGGKLFMSDLYIKNPTPELVEKLKAEVEAFAVTPHKDGECNDTCAEEHKKRTVDFRTSGRFLIEPLLKQLKEIGYQNIQWEDRSSDLDTYVAEEILKNGSLENCFCSKDIVKDKEFKTGYFMLTAEKGA